MSARKGKKSSVFIRNGRIRIKLKSNMLSGKFPEKFFSLLGKNYVWMQFDRGRLKEQKEIVTVSCKLYLHFYQLIFLIGYRHNVVK